MGSPTMLPNEVVIGPESLVAHDAALVDAEIVFVEVVLSVGPTELVAEVEELLVAKGGDELVDLS